MPRLQTLGLAVAAAVSLAGCDRPGFLSPPDHEPVAVHVGTVAAPATRREPAVAPAPVRRALIEGAAER